MRKIVFSLGVFLSGISSAFAAIEYGSLTIANGDGGEVSVSRVVKMELGPQSKNISVRDIYKQLEQYITAQYGPAKGGKAEIGDKDGTFSNPKDVTKVKEGLMTFTSVAAVDGTLAVDDSAVTYYVDAKFSAFPLNLISSGNATFHLSIQDQKIVIHFSGSGKKVENKGGSINFLKDKGLKFLGKKGLDATQDEAAQKTVDACLENVIAVIKKSFEK